MYDQATLVLSTPGTVIRAIRPRPLTSRLSTLPASTRMARCARKNCSRTRSRASKTRRGRFLNRLHDVCFRNGQNAILPDMENPSVECVTDIIPKASSKIQFCLRQDDDGDWYLLPVSKLEIWNRLEPKIAKERCSRVEFKEWRSEIRVHAVDSISNIHFSNPEISKD